MPILSPSTIFAPGRNPPKAEIIQFLETIQGAAASPAVVKQTKAALDLVNPASQNYGGLVLNDPDATKNGYYYRAAGSWVKGRGFPDTFARITLGGPANAQTGSVSAGVSAGEVLVYFAEVVTENTGAMTLALAGGSARSVVNAAGNALMSGEWSGVVMFYLNGDGQYQLLFDADAVAQTAQNSTDAATARDEAEAAAVLAASIISGVIAPKATVAAAIADDPAVDPDYYDVQFYDSAYIPGSGAKYKKVASNPGHAGSFQNANATWYEIAEPEIRWSMFGYVSGAITSANFLKPWTAGIAIGCRRFVLPDQAVTLNNTLNLVVPADYGKVYIKGVGRLFFSFTIPGNSVDLLRITGNGIDPVEVDLRVNGAGMGRYPDVWKVCVGFIVEEAPNSIAYADVQECFGFGFRIWTSPNSTVYANTLNCDGQKVTNEAGVFDNYGDGIYVGCPNITLISPRVITENGGRSGITFEGYFEDDYSGVVIDPYVKGYDRNIHVEGVTNSGTVVILGGELLDATAAGVYNFSAAPVTVKGTKFRNDERISEPVLVPDTFGYISCYGAGSVILTEDCEFMDNNAPSDARAVWVGADASYVSRNDTFRLGCGPIESGNAKFLEIRNANGETGDSIDAFGAGRFHMEGGRWCGLVLVPEGVNDAILKNFTMGKVVGGTWCGIIDFKEKRGGVIQDIRFEDPEVYCVNNQRASVAGPLPVIEGIIAIRSTAASTPAVLAFTSHTGTPPINNYRASHSSWVWNTFANTAVEWVPRISD